MYRIAFPTAGGPKNCPVEGCPGRAAKRTEMRVQFLPGHVRDIVVILEEENLSRPWFPRCDMLVPCCSLNKRHTATDQCARGAEWKQSRMVEEELREILERAF